MENKNLFVAGVGILLAAALAFSLTGSEETRRGETVEASGNYSVTEDGTRYTVHPSEISAGCPGMDCIPSIDNPKYVTGNPDWMDPGNLVIGVEIDGDARAFPLKILDRHEIVNTEVGGEPVAVTYCPLCRSGFTYSREINGDTVEFGVSGKLYNANLVMYDRKTETYWSQLTGEAMLGPMVPEELELVHSSITNWSQWKQEHPDTRLLSRNTGIYSASTYSGSAYAGYESSGRVGFGVGKVDDRLHSKELVYGVKTGGEAKAYTEEDIRQEKLIQDEVGGVPIMFFVTADGSISVFERRVADETLSFSRTGSGLVDGDGNTWSFSGEALEGRYQGEKLGRLNSHGIYWFAWSKFHPDTKVYNQGG